MTLFAARAPDAPTNPTTSHCPRLGHVVLENGREAVVEGLFRCITPCSNRGKRLSRLAHLLLRAMSLKEGKML